MKKANFVLIISSLFLLAYTHAFAQVEATTANRGLIKGVVTDTATPRPNNISNANVIVESEFLLGTQTRTAITDAAGNYEIPNLPPGEYVVTTSKPGYDDSLEFVTVTPGGEAFHDVRLYQTDTSLTYFWKLGPAKWPLLFYFMLLLAAIVVGIAYVIHRIVKLRKLKLGIAEAFISRVIGPLQNGDVMAAISICDEVGGLANILKVGLLRYAELGGRGEVTGEGVRQAIWQEKVREATEEAGAKAKKELRFHWWLIAAMYGIIGGMSLLYGLIGAMDIVRANTAMAFKGTGDPQLLAGRIAEASLTVVFGLGNAIHCANLCIVAFIIYLIYRKKVNNLISRTQQTFVNMVNSLSTTQISGKTDQ